MPIDPQLDAYSAPATEAADGRRVGVLLSHGFTGNPSSMRPWAEHLNTQGYAVSVPRLPGHGTTWQDMQGTTYSDWYGELERAFEKLQADCDQVVVGGLSMGGCLALDLAAQRGREVAAIVVVNPSVSTERKDVHLLPVLKHVVPSFPAIGDDIKKPGVTERAYPRTPLRAAHSMMQGMKAVRARLPQVTQPLLVFRAQDDHVVPASSTRLVMTTVSSRDLEERVLENSYHVATLDNDAEEIFTGSTEFIRRVTAPAASTAES